MLGEPKRRFSTGFSALHENLLCIFALLCLYVLHVFREQVVSLLRIAESAQAATTISTRVLDSGIRKKQFAVQVWHFCFGLILFSISFLCAPQRCLMFRFFHRYEDVSVESTVRKQLHLMQAITYFIIIRVDVFCYGELLILDKVALVK